MNSLRSLMVKATLPVQLVARSVSTASVHFNKQIPNYNLKNRVAIVTASTDGIGLAIARRLGQSGASVVISSRKESNVENAVQTLKEEGLTVAGQVCHVGKPEHRQSLIDFTIQQFGAIDILVSNAATNPQVGQILDVDEAAFDKIFEINVKAAFMLTKEVVPHMEKRGGGSIVYISSIGAYQIMPLLSAYSISKTALLGLTKAAASQLAASNIRVNCVAPGVIKTRFSKALWENEGAVEEIHRNLMIKRIGEPDEISGAVAFLSSDDASYITGESLVVGGGFFTRL